MERTIWVGLPTDENGLTGRKCPACGDYFKLRFGTGLPISTTTCPYCRHTADSSDFLTDDQREYVLSVVKRQVAAPMLQDFLHSLERMAYASQRSFIQIRVRTSPISFPLHRYRERDVETQVTCDGCGLEFAIFGVFAGCPDCGELNAWVVFEKSLTVATKRLQLAESLGPDDPEMREALLRDTLVSACAAFDGLGKALRERNPQLFPAKPPNLFQNVEALSQVLQGALGRNLADLIGADRAEFLRKMLQVRHLCEHNMGVVDAKFVARVPALAHLRGRKYPLQQGEVENLLSVLKDTAAGIRGAVGT